MIVMVMDELIKKAESNLSPEALNNLKTWLANSELATFYSEIEKLIEAENWRELEDTFYTHVRVGTGGVRGMLGAGPNRINLRTIGEAAQGLSQFIVDFGEEAKRKGVVIGYDARKLGKEFAQLSCSVFAANGIKSYLFDGLRATPEISFAISHLGTTAGVMLTASHNPRTDNGFKFYWTDGGQVVPPYDLKFMELVENVTEIKKIDFEDAKKQGLIQMVGQEVDQAYINAVRGLSLTTSRSAKIVFSPIHGSGSTNVTPVLQAEGFDVTIVPEQAAPDENFPTATGDLINPEYREVMDLPMKLGEKVGADVVINADPDADRIGVAAKITPDSNQVQFLTGNEVGTALVHFVLNQLKKQGKLTPRSLVIETYVTTTLISDIAKSFEIRIIDDLLVGFKYIGEIIQKLENKQSLPPSLQDGVKDDFVFAAEESLGYLRGNFLRDKDSAIAALTLAELVSRLKDQGKTLIQYLDEIYTQYSYYKNILNMQEMRGRVGFENITKIMLSLRFNPPTEFAGMKVLKTIDRWPPEKRTPEQYKTGATGDQITFIFSADEKTRLTARPSGTEPKIKYYIQHQAKVTGDLTQTKKAVDEVAYKLEQAILDLEKQIITT